MEWTCGRKDKEANNSLGFLRRHLAKCPRNTKAQCYTSLVRLILEYASAAWDPHTSRNIILQMEMVQCRAARFASWDYSQMMSNLGWNPLQKRRSNTWLVMMYRTTNGFIDIQGDRILNPAKLSICGRSMLYILLFCRTDFYRNSLIHL